jgi:hypothetical protein
MFNNFQKPQPQQQQGLNFNQVTNTNSMFNQQQQPLQPFQQQQQPFQQQQTFQQQQQSFQQQQQNTMSYGSINQQNQA